MLSFKRTFVSSVCRAQKAAAATATGIFSGIPQSPPDPILGLSASFRSESNPKKINLSVGAYRDEEGKPWILPSVNLAYKKLNELKLNKEYTGINGSIDYKNLVKSFLFDSFDQGSGLIKSDRISISQTLSGTGALTLTGKFMNKWLNIEEIYVPKPTWANHINVFQTTGLTPKFYSYLAEDGKSINFNGLIEDLKNSKQGSAVLLHACCHNPTGLDPLREQWPEILKIISEKKLIPIVDMAYQGFESGSLKDDLHVVKLMISEIEKGSIPTMFLCQSFAKNMGLYGERIGSLSIITPDQITREVVDSQMQKIIRAVYSSPPIHGSQIVEQVLANEEIFQQWEKDVKVMANRIKDMRVELFNNLKARDFDWSHLVNQNGMFCYTGLTKEQVLKLRSDYGIYCTLDGRFSISGINKGNVEYLADSIAKVLK